MAPHYKPLKDINDKTKFYKCKVTVLHKGNPQQPANKPRYQRLILKDDEGFTMKAALFGSDIEAYAEALQRNGIYEIANAPVKAVPTQYATRENEFSMTINKRADIIPLTMDRNISQPQYQTIMSLPQNADADDLFDILGVIIFVGKPKNIKHLNRNDDQVTEIYITDDTCTDHPYMISTWNQLSNLPDRLLQTWADKYIVVGFTALKIKQFKGFTLTSSMSTEIIINLKGSKADNLRTWIRQNEALLTTQRSKLTTILAYSIDTPATSIEEINKKMAHDIWQEEQFVICGTTTEITSAMLKVYIGCSNCGKSINAEDQTITNCTQCSSNNITCIPRATLKTEIIDATGAIELLFFSKETELITQYSCSDLWTLKDNPRALDEKLKAVTPITFRILIGPTTGLSRSRILSWAVRSVSINQPVS